MAAGPVTKVEVACVHCGSDDTNPLWSGREHEYDNTTDEEFHFVRCTNCGLVRLNPRPAVSELPRIYPPNYYAYNLVSDDAGKKPGLPDRLKKRMYQRRIKGMVNRLGKQGRIRFLDIGCGDGRLLDWYRASPLGDRIDTHGIEMDEGAAEIARRRGHHVITGRFEVDQELDSGTYDLMTAAHVIEHVDDPETFARRGAELLAPGGMFVLYTPNWDSPAARRARGNWGGNHFPRHWTLYDERTLNALAESIGLELERVEYQPNPIFGVWTCHSWLKQRFPNSRWPDRLFPPIGIFHPGLRSFLLLSTFTLFDLVVRLFTGKTGSIAVELRKPGPQGRVIA